MPHHHLKIGIASKTSYGISIVGINMRCAARPGGWFPIHWHVGIVVLCWVTLFRVLFLQMSKTRRVTKINTTTKLPVSLHQKDCFLEQRIVHNIKMLYKDIMLETKRMVVSSDFLNWSLTYFCLHQNINFCWEMQVT